MSKSETSRITIITGGAKGIGAAISRRFATDGHRVALVGRDASALEAMCGELAAAGGESFPVVADLAQPDAADLIAKAVEDKWGAAEVLINNAGATRDNLLIRMGTEDFTDILNLNLTASFALAKRCTRPMMKARWGRIINMSSIVAIMGNPGQANYISAKAGLIGLTKAFAAELASRNITVNAVAPGFIETEMTASLPEDLKAKYMERIPLGRFGSGDDVAGVVAFLASDEAAYITGQTIRVDGGMLMA